MGKKKKLFSWEDEPICLDVDFQLLSSTRLTKMNFQKNLSLRKSDLH